MRRLSKNLVSLTRTIPKSQFDAVHGFQGVYLSMIMAAFKEQAHERGLTLTDTPRTEVQLLMFDSDNVEVTVSAHHK